MKQLFLLTAFLLSHNGFSQTLFEKCNDHILKNEKEKTILKLMIEDNTTENITSIKLNYNNFFHKNFQLYVNNEVLFIENYRLEKRSERNFSVFAEIPNKDGHIYLTYLNGDLIGNMLIDFQYYEIKTIGSDNYYLRKYNQRKYPDCGNKKPQHDTKIIELKNHNKLKLGPVEPCSLRVLVVYTPAVANAVNNAQNLCQHSIDVMNQTFINSGINHQVQLAYSGEIDYNESGFSQTDLKRFGTNFDGFMDDVHSLRDNYSADVCVLISTSDNDLFFGGKLCGIAGAVYSDQAHAFCQVNYNCSVNHLTFPHEIGHLLGAKHESPIASTPFANAHAFINSARTERSVMHTPLSNSALRIPYWSNPSTIRSGSPFGASNRNNAAVLNSTINDFRTFRAPLGYVTIQSNILSNVSSASLIAEDIVTSGSFDINNGTIYQLQADKSVTLTDGFTAHNGSEFLANVYPDVACSGNPNAGGESNGGDKPTFDVRDISSSIENQMYYVYPNPTSDNVIIKKVAPSEDKVNIEILDLSGKVLFNGSMKNDTSLNFSNYTEGVYVINVGDSKFKVVYKNTK